MGWRDSSKSSRLQLAALINADIFNKPFAIGCPPVSADVLLLPFVVLFVHCSTAGLSYFRRIKHQRVVQ